jgi:hypothetical protein
VPTACASAGNATSSACITPFRYVKWCMNRAT